MAEKFEVSKAVIEKDGKYLLLKRASRSRSYPDLWDFPGGKHEPNETPSESLIRETKEETSFDIDPGAELKTAAYEDDEHELLFHYFAPTKVSGELRLSADHSEYRWVGREELEDLELHPSIRLFLAQAKSSI